MTSHYYTYDISGVRVIEPLQQLQHGGLAAARGAHQRHRLAGFRLQVDALQHSDVRTRRVTELHIFETEVPGCFLQTQCFYEDKVDKRSYQLQANSCD